nr:MAG TPA: hypothetical protein [Caudoviricetes sp.]
MGQGGKPPFPLRKQKRIQNPLYIGDSKTIPATRFSHSTFLFLGMTV